MKHLFKGIKLYFRGLMLSKGKGILVLLFTAMIAVSCNKYGKLLKSNDVELKYKAAKEYYEKKDYVKAAPLFDDLLITLKGDSRFEEVYFYYANSRYHLGEIVMASYHFYNFFESFPLSKWAEEALYMHVYCDYLESYPYYLDPSVTRDAMNSLQLFINVYPASPRVAECNKYLDELRGRLRTKSLQSAYLYLKTQDYKAATIAFHNTLKDYPELENKNEVEYLIVKCNYLLALNSIESKQEERFRDVGKAYRDYVENNGTSDKFHADAVDYHNRALKYLREVPVKNAGNLLAEHKYQEAVQAYRQCLASPDVENKEKVHYHLVLTYFKAGVNGEQEDKAQNLRMAIAESDAYIGTYGADAASYKKVVKLRKRAEKKLNKLS